MAQNVLTLKQVQRKLKTEQHVLIHLCEKGVIEPDFQQTEGRGSHREFSDRNLLEFALALAIRKYGIPVSTTAAIVKLLKSFERSTQKRIKGFNLLDYLQGAEKGANLLLFLFDGEYMVFGVELNGTLASMTGFNIGKVNDAAKQVKLDHLDALPEDFDSYLKVDLKRLANRLQ